MSELILDLYFKIRLYIVGVGQVRVDGIICVCYERRNILLFKDVNNSNKYAYKLRCIFPVLCHGKRRGGEGMKRGGKERSRGGEVGLKR